MDLRERRNLLKCSTNPDNVHDYMSVLEGKIRSVNLSAQHELKICYVPDKLILNPDSLNHYLSKIGSFNWPSQEEITTTILGDLQNEVVPRWVHITLQTDITSLDHVDRHISIAEDAQPAWENDAFLNRLGFQKLV